MATSSVELKSRRREDYAYSISIATRWSDNDQYSHVNNVVYYEYFDSCVNTYLVQHCSLNPADSPCIGLVVSSHCEFFNPASFPDILHIGLRVVKLGNSSSTYEFAVFPNNSVHPAAVGGYTHVFVHRSTRKSCPLPQPIRDGLSKLLPQAKL